MTARRIALWWRLLLAVGVLSLPVATSAAPAVSASVQHAATVQAVAPATATAPGAQVHHSRHVHRTAPMVAAVAAPGLAFVVLIVGTGVGRRRASQLLSGIRHWRSSRAPPSRTSFLVLFGLASGRAGRLSRSRRALDTRTTPAYC